MINLKVFKVLILSLVVSSLAGWSAAGTAGDLAAGEKEPKTTAPETYRRSFQDWEITVIFAYFRDNKDLPPGLAKKNALPPGLEKQVRERGALPPGLEKRMRPLPINLERKLAHLPDRQLRVLVGLDVVLMDTKDNIILDVIEGVLGRH